MNETRVEMEYMYMPKTFASRYKKATDERAQMQVIEEILQETRKSMRGDLDAMEEDTLRFKGMLLGYKQAYTEVLEQHKEAVYAVWEKLDEQMPDMKAKAKKLLSDMSEVKPEVEKVSYLVEELGRKLDSVNVYSLGKTVELVKEIASCDEKTIELLKKMFS